MFPGGTAPKVPACDDNFVLCLSLTLCNEALRVLIIREANQRVGSELVILLLDSWNKSQVLGWDNLVGVDVVFDDVDRRSEAICHNK